MDAFATTSRCDAATLAAPVRLYGDASFACGFTSALSAIERDDEKRSEQALKPLKSALQEVATACKDVQEVGQRFLRTAHDTEEEESARSRLVQIGRLISRMHELVQARDELWHKVYNLDEYWPQEWQDIFFDTLEFLENMEETMALGLSQDFKKEVDEVRKEAGLAVSSAKHAVPTDPNCP